MRNDHAYVGKTEIRGRMAALDGAIQRASERLGSRCVDPESPTELKNAAASVDRVVSTVSGPGRRSWSGVALVSPESERILLDLDSAVSSLRRISACRAHKRPTDTESGPPG